MLVLGVVLVMLFVVTTERVERVVNVLTVPVRKLAHRVESVHVIYSRAGESMAFADF